MIHAAAMAFLLASGVSWAEDFDAALEAYDAGDVDTAYEIWRPMAEQGDAEAQFRLGHIYRGALDAPWRWGVTLRKDYAEAVRWYRLAAEQGHADAQIRLGMMYADGQGVDQDHTEMLRWYRAAAEQGHVDAQSLLGTVYRRGQGVNQDAAKAARWYRAAAKQGQGRSQFRLGLLYSSGRGVIRDYTTAHMWFNIAARSEDAYAARAKDSLDSMMGGGKSEEYRESYIALMTFDASGARDSIENRMTPEAIAEAQRRARVCINSGYEDCD